MRDRVARRLRSQRIECSRSENGRRFDGNRCVVDQSRMLAWARPIQGVTDLFVASDSELEGVVVESALLGERGLR